MTISQLITETAVTKIIIENSNKARKQEKRDETINQQIGKDWNCLQ